MTSQNDVQQFIQRFTRIWRSLSAEEYPTLYHDDAKILDPGMDAPIEGAGLQGYIRGLLAICPDLELTPAHWAFHDGSLFVDWTLNGTVAGKRIHLRGADRFELEGDRARFGIAYFDRLTLWEANDPACRERFLRSFAR